MVVKFHHYGNCGHLQYFTHYPHYTFLYTRCCQYTSRPHMHEGILQPKILKLGPAFEASRGSLICLISVWLSNGPESSPTGYSTSHADRSACQDLRTSDHKKRARRALSIKGKIEKEKGQDWDGSSYWSSLLIEVSSLSLWIMANAV